MASKGKIKAVTLTWGEERIAATTLARAYKETERQIEESLVDHLCDTDCGSVTRGKTVWNIAVAVRLVKAI
jgi:hypothetical protein